MHKVSQFFAVAGAVSLWLTVPAFSQTVIPFDTAQQYTDNFNVVVNSGGASNPNPMRWSSGRITMSVTDLSTAAGVALYNPNASTTAGGPTYTTSTVEADTSTNPFASSAGTIGIVARAQADGSAVFASYFPARSGLAIAITYGQGYGINGTSLYYSNLGFSFSPTHISLAQYQVNGVPTFFFTGRDNSGHSFSTGVVSLAGTTAYNAPGQVGFAMYATGLGAGAVDNFSFAPTVPEPDAWVLCSLVLVAGGMWLRRQGSESAAA